MNTGRLLELYDRISEAPDAVSRLRGFILDLAVRGKLVDQDPEDEPAPNLLKLIAAEREKRVENKEIKQSKSSEPIEEGPFELPSSWIWIPLGTTGNILSGNSINQTTREKLEKIQRGYPFVATKDVGYGLNVIDYANGLLVDPADDRFKVARARSVLICAEGGSAGKKIGLTDRNICFGNKLLANETWSVVSPEFMRYVYMSDFFFAEFSGKMAGVIGGISIRNFMQLPFPLPPLAEQHRIVAKVDELMALCGRLEGTHNTRKATRDRLTTATLSRVTAPNTDDQTFQSHARFALDALPALTAQPDQIKTLRQIIVDLAVRGRLVAQNPQDEPATALLERIAAGKERRKRETRDKRINSAPAPSRESYPESLPGGWSLQSFENLFLFIDYRGKTPAKKSAGVPLITAKNVRMGTLNREPREYVSQSTFEAWMTRGLPQIGDLLFTTEAPLANVCLNDIDERFALAQRIVCLQPYSEFDTCFFMRAIMSDLIQKMIADNATGMTAKGIKSAKLKPLPLPVPPLQEQRRIGAKIDELMALCDQLETSLAEAETTRSRLLKSVLHEALQPATEGLEAA